MTSWRDIEKIDARFLREWRYVNYDQMTQFWSVSLRSPDDGPPPIKKYVLEELRVEDWLRKMRTQNGRKTALSDLVHTCPLYMYLENAFIEQIPDKIIQNVPTEEWVCLRNPKRGTSCLKYYIHWCGVQGIPDTVYAEMTAQDWLSCYHLATIAEPDDLAYILQAKFWQDDPHGMMKVWNNAKAEVKDSETRLFYQSQLLEVVSKQRKIRRMAL